MRERVFRRSGDPFERFEAGRLENILTTVAEMRSAIVRAMILLLKVSGRSTTLRPNFLPFKGRRK